MAGKEPLARIERIDDAANTFGSTALRVLGGTTAVLAGVELARDALILGVDKAHGIALQAMEPTIASLGGDIGLIAAGAVLLGPVAHYFGQLPLQRDRQTG